VIEISKLSQSEVGAWVEYRDRFDSKPDKGRIKSWNQKFIFVVYRCAGNWDEFESYTGVATDPADLNFQRAQEAAKWAAK
jgi:hypothetical protein